MASGANKLIIRCAQCGKAYKGLPGTKRYKCTHCEGRFTFPDQPRTPDPGQILCSCCWTSFDKPTDPVPCPECGQAVHPDFGGRAGLARNTGNQTMVALKEQPSASKTLMHDSDRQDESPPSGATGPTELATAPTVPDTAEKKNGIQEPTRLVVQQMEQRLQSLEKELTSARKQHTTLLVRRDELDKRRLQLEENLADARKQLKDAAAEKAALQMERNELRAQVESANDYVKAMEGRLDEAKQDRNRYEGERDELALLRQDMERELAKLRKELEEERHSHRAAQSEREKLEALREELRGKVNDLREKLQTEIRRKSDLEKENSELQRSFSKLSIDPTVRGALTPGPEAAASDTTVPPPLAPSAIERRNNILQKVPPPPALTLAALREYMLRDEHVNATLLVALHLDEVPYTEVARILREGGFTPLPPTDLQETHQNAIMQYVCTVFEARPDDLCCAARNVKLDNAEDKVGRISRLGMTIDDADCDAELAGLRQVVSQHGKDHSLRYLCLPPLDLKRLTTPLDLALQQTPIMTPPPGVETFRVDGPFLRSRSRDLAFVSWVQKRWPDGARLNDVIDAIEYADWLISLLAYTTYPGDTREGKRMLVRLACICAARAQRWAPRSDGRAALVAAELWVDDPTEENRLSAGRVADEVMNPDPKDGARPEGAALYIQQAANEAAARAARAAHAKDPERINSHAARAAASSVMAASFASNADAAGNHWLELITDRLAPDEAQEHRALCDAIRQVVAQHKA